MIDWAGSGALLLTWDGHSLKANPSWNLIISPQSLHASGSTRVPTGAHVLLSPTSSMLSQPDWQ